MKRKCAMLPLRQTKKINNCEIFLKTRVSGISFWLTKYIEYTFFLY